MPSLRERLVNFVQLIERGESLASLQQYYAPDVIVFENREMARAGLARCLAHEREVLAGQPEAARARAHRFAADEATGCSFIEWDIRFLSKGGRPMRLEQVAVQKWSGERIAEERFYYEGYVDEGD